MSERKVEFSGTMQNTVSETTQSKFTGTGKIIGLPRTSIFLRIAWIVAIFTISCAFVLKYFFEINLSAYLDSPYSFEKSPPSDNIQSSTPSPERSIVPQAREQAQVQEPLYEKSSLPDDGYIIIVGTVDSQKDARGFASKVRQKRINANYFIQEAKYHVYVGPFYAKRSAVSALNAVHQAGFTEAYLQPPYSR